MYTSNQTSATVDLDYATKRLAETYRHTEEIGRELDVERRALNTIEDEIAGFSTEKWLREHPAALQKDYKT